MARVAGNKKSAENEQLEYYKKRIIKKLNSVKYADYMKLKQLSVFVDAYLSEA